MLRGQYIVGPLQEKFHRECARGEISTRVSELNHARMLA